MDAEVFLARLLAVAGRCAFTPSDLSVWFARPRFTMRTWLDRACHRAHGHLPTTEGPTYVECVRRLKLLEQNAAYFPVPYEVLKNDRRAYIKKAFMNANNGGVPDRRPSEGRDLLRRRPRPGT